MCHLGAGKSQNILDVHRGNNTRPVTAHTIHNRTIAVGIKRKNAEATSQSYSPSSVTHEENDDDNDSSANKRSRTARNCRSGATRVPRADQLGYYSPTSQKILQASKESYRTWLGTSEPFPSPEARNNRSCDAYEEAATALGDEGELSSHPASVLISELIFIA
jgi:hypothetical protein